MRKRLFRLLVIAVVLVLIRAALADRSGRNTETRSTSDDTRRVVIGADLNETEIAAVYSLFGLERGSISELRLTNSEERAYLQNGVNADAIGTRTVSCVFMELMPEGSGLTIQTSNISWTPEMYSSSLATAGITDARIAVAAPFPVTGTGALAGIYKAYEDMTGKRLNAENKAAGSQELSLLGELARQIGSVDSTVIVREIKQLLAQGTALSDWELREQMLQISSRLHVTLTEEQLGQLVTLFRSLQGLDSDALQQHMDGLHGAMQRVSEAREKAETVMDEAGAAVRAVSGFFRSVRDLFR